MKTALWTVQVLWGAFFSITWFSPVPQDLFIFIGVCEFLGGAGLILPAITGVKPKLVLGGVAAFIAYGRLLVRRIAPASIGTFRVLKGLAVLGAPVLAGFAPVWYKLTRTH